MSIINNLPESGIGHLIELDREIIKDVISISNPKNIIETGFNAGHSSVLFLEESLANILSIDIVSNLPAKNIIDNEFPRRHVFLHMDSKEFLEKYHKKNKKTYDLFFIDGDHSSEGCYQDILIGHKLNIPYILIDDYWIGVKTGIEKFFSEYPNTYKIKKQYDRKIPIVLFERIL